MGVRTGRRLFRGEDITALLSSIFQKRLLTVIYTYGTCFMEKACGPNRDLGRIEFMIERYFSKTSSLVSDTISHLSGHVAIIRYQKLKILSFLIRHSTLGSLSSTVIISSLQTEQVYR